MTSVGTPSAKPSGSVLFGQNAHTAICCRTRASPRNVPSASRAIELESMRATSSLHVDAQEHAVRHDAPQAAVRRDRRAREGLEVALRRAIDEQGDLTAREHGLEFPAQVGEGFATYRSRVALREGRVERGLGLGRSSDERSDGGSWTGAGDLHSDLIFARQYLGLRLSEVSRRQRA